MAVTTTNLIMGPADLYIGSFGATEPLDTAVNVSPAASSWTDLGGTQDGVKLSVDQTYTPLEVDQIVDEPGARLTKRMFTIETNLADHAWIDDHYDDLDADFLAVYGIDLDRTVVGAKRFLARAVRLPAYRSVVAARMDAEQQDQPAPPQGDATPDVPVDAMNLLVPGLIERAEV